MVEVQVTHSENIALENIDYPNYQLIIAEPVNHQPRVLYLVQEDAIILAEDLYIPWHTESKEESKYGMAFEKSGIMVFTSHEGIHTVLDKVIRDFIEKGHIIDLGVL